MRRFWQRAAIGLAMWAATTAAEVRLPAVIGDNMVLQRSDAAAIFGFADAGERVTVRLAEQEAATTADEHGRWRVTLDTRAVEGVVAIDIEGANRLTVRNVLIGEVWICSGQSNMDWPVQASRDADLEIAAATNPLIRLFRVERKIAMEPQLDVSGRWELCDPSTLAPFSAVGYSFGRAVSAALQTPVGLVHTAWGGTPAEAWTPRAALALDEQTRPIMERFDAAMADQDRLTSEYEARLKEWEAGDRSRADRPRPPLGPKNPSTPGVLFDGMIAPLTPMTIRGAIWYQGESNAARAEQYRALFPMMIQQWREAWGAGEFPFLFVQLANFMQRRPEPQESNWAELREAQAMTVSASPRAGMAVTIDIGTGHDIHPRNKQDVGRRLARLALSQVYGRDLAASGPTMSSVSMEGDAARVRFDGAKGLRTSDGQPPRGFAVAGEDRVWRFAEATIDGESVVVRAADVSAPVAVRYAWADNPDVNLINGADLPAAPFRSDNWPMRTAGQR